jgi:ABC-type multidrug transport system ATPase subunit
MKQKLALACALVHEPELLVLDEPTNGVDPVARREFWRLLTGLRRDGATVLVSTAYLDEAELCARIGFMAGGRLLVTGTPAELRARTGQALLEVVARRAPRRSRRPAPSRTSPMSERSGIASRSLWRPAPISRRQRRLAAALAAAGVDANQCARWRRPRRRRHPTDQD